MAPPAASLESVPVSALPHPLLRGGQPPFPHKFSPSQMEALEALCTTFVPSISSKSEDKDFYELTMGPEDAAMVAGRMTQFIHPRLLRRASEVLDVLSAGKSTADYPYDKKFCDLPLEDREKLMYAWANSDNDGSRLNFKIFKTFILNTFYSKVDASGWNPTWKAIGYSGPDPDSMNATLPPKPKVLKDSIFDSRETPDLCATLQAAGFSPAVGAKAVPASLQNAALELGSDEEAASAISLEVDVIIIGAGSGGSVPAQVLTTVGGLKVLVIEKGRYFAREDLSLLEEPTFTNLYEEGGFLATDDFGYSLMSAAVVGGGTCINWAASFRTPPHVLKEWSEENKVPLFASDKYQQALDVICKKIGVQPNANVESFQNAVLRKGCVELGYHSANIPRNANPDHYCGCCNLGCRRGMKQATTETWLVEAARAGCVILTGVKADKVLFEAGSTKKKKAVGVVATTLGDHPRKLVIAAKATIVSTGTIMTPPLLLRSGLTNPNIGKNFHIHPVLGVWGYFPDETAEPHGTSFEGGIMTAFSAVNARWDTSGYGPVLMTPSFHPGQHASFVTWKSGEQHKEVMRRYRRTSQVVLFTRDKGSGSIGLDDKGELKVEYTLDPYDEEVMVEAAEKGLRVLKASGAVEVGTHHHDAESFVFANAGSGDWKSEKERFEKYLSEVRAKGLKPNRMPMVSYHLLGSCRMGDSPDNSAVDPNGETWDAEGLFLTDASVFPTPTGLNPMVTIQSIAYCTAHNVIEFVKRA